MKQVFDIATGNDADVVISAASGDFSFEESTNKHVHSIVADAPGDYIGNPAIGVNVLSWVDSESPAKLLQEISRQLRDDRFVSQKVSFAADGSINVDGSY